MGCFAAPSMKPAGSTTESPSMTKARTRTEPSRFFRGCAGPRSASTIGSGVHLHQYAGEMAWREDNRRKADLHGLVGDSLNDAPVSCLGLGINTSFVKI